MTAFLTVMTLGLLLAAPAQSSDIEREAHEIEALLIAPCCFSQQVSQHQSPAAAEVRQDVRRRLAAGETREQILQAYVAQHGKRILATPPDEGFDRILHLLPPVGLVLTAAFLVVVFRRFTRARAAAPSEASPVAPAAAGADDRYRHVLDDELRDLD
jgi:cytochrome c-type biogenesis protein CcmH